MKHRFRAVEFSIFAVVSLIFLNSVYNLFTEGRVVGSVARAPLAPPEGQRQPAKTGPSDQNDVVGGFVPYETRCSASGEVFETTAAKVRILGPFCGAAGRHIAGVAGSPMDYKIENTTTRYTATVFSDTDAGKFSTDFIPLESGANKIVMEFRYKAGKVIPVELTVIRR